MSLVFTSFYSKTLSKHLVVDTYAIFCFMSFSTILIFKGRVRRCPVIQKLIENNVSHVFC